MSEGHSERLNAALGGRYRITRELGEGGMATVYLADDLRHQRPVALKVLRPELAAVVGGERFLAEIKTTANLQHPHILPLFDSGEADKLLFYVMPYVEGESLRDKLDREHQLPVEEATRIATNVAEALDYAHRQGVVHRDIKPANILLLDGKPVISDFGIALAVTARGTGRLTETGLSLGTPHYMSPEQATGDQGVGPAADIWALGCVLFEMLVGVPPYTGSTPQAVLGKIVMAEPVSATKLRKLVPANVDATIRKALEKVPADRFTSASEFVRALADPGFRHGEAAGAGADTASQGHWNRLSMVLTGAVAVTSALAAWGWLRPAADLGPADVMRFTIVPPEDAPLDFLGNHPDLAISPDGRQIVYQAPGPDETGPMLYVRALDELVGVPLRGAEGGLGPVVSPDGAWVAFLTRDRPSALQRVSIFGGAPVTLAESPSSFGGVSWGTDDSIIFGTSGGGLFRVPAGGGEPEALTTLDRDQGDASHLWPAIIEGRNAVVFVIAEAGFPLLTGQLAVLDLSSGEVTRLGIDGVSPRYVPTGHLVYAAQDGSVRAVPFDARSLTVTGTTVPLIEGVAMKFSGATDVDVSRDGRLVYALGPAGASLARSLVWVGRDGREEPIAAPPRPYVNTRLSPDGRRLALDVRDGLRVSIWIWDLAGETLTQLALGDDSYGEPTWTPDGGRIAYSTRNGPISWKASNNTGVPEVLAAFAGDSYRNPIPNFFTPDGMALVFRHRSNPQSSDLTMVRVGGDTTPLWRLDGAFNELNAELSPDGRWMAYQSDESGAYEVYVRPFPDVEGDQVQISNHGGITPLWSRDGRELFYLQPGAPVELISTSVDTGGADRTFAFQSREVALDWTYLAAPFGGRTYDVSPDGRRFLAIKQPDAAGGGAALEINVVLNWFEEVRQRMVTP